VLAARNRAEHYRKVVLPLRERIVQDTQEQYNAMQVGAFQLLIAKQQEIDAGNRYIETVRDYWLARTELEVILSGTLPRSERPGGAGTVSWGENMAEGQGGQRD
jgi:cobalt-zinc-cadmium efflux system outer membrane protein